MANNSAPPGSDHDRANSAYLKGDYPTAIEIQSRVVKDHLEKGKKAIVARKLLALYLYSAKHFDAAIDLLKALVVEQPDDAESLENIGVMLRHSGKHTEAVEYLCKAAEMAPDKFNIYDGLAHCYHTLRQPEEVQRYGRMSLELKDECFQGGQSWDVPQGPPPVFNEKRKDRNVISFSLFGDNPRYLHGALRNIRVASDLYPSWVCRFYCDSQVPGQVIDEMKSLGCQVVMKPKPLNFYEGLLWRFEVINDPSIDRFLIRDCDSVVNIKERVAVDEWIASDQWFHAMRDFSSHTELILAGMWGGVSGVLPSLDDLDDAFNPKTAATRTYDQHLLREMVWPTMRKSVLIHDSVFTGCLGSIQFPEVGALPFNRHVGQNEAAVISADQMVFRNDTEQDSVKKFFVFGHHKGGIDLLQQLLNQHPEAKCPPRHHLSAIDEINKQATTRYAKLIDLLNERSGQKRVEFDQPALQGELYTTWLTHLFSHYSDGMPNFGITDAEIDECLGSLLEIVTDAKFVFVVRDPRDIAVSSYDYRKEVDPSFDRDGSKLTMIAESAGDNWLNKVQNVQRFNREKPGRIELVRFEDLVSEGKGESTLKRILEFLDLNTSGSTIDSMLSTLDPKEQASVGQWRDRLSPNQIGLIESKASEVMTLLRYQLSPHDYRSVETDDTILPS